jgi:hypothetical protein
MSNAKHKSSAVDPQSPVVRLPLLKTDGPCQCLTVCGEFGGDTLPDAWAEQPPNLQSQYVTDGHCNYVRAFVHNRHLHVDVAVCGFFQSPPQADDEIAGVHAALGEAIGREIRVGIEGTYQIPLSEAPDFIRSLLRLEAKVGAVSLKMKGSDFEISGAPATRMKWSLPVGSENLCITLETEKQIKIDESYLESCFCDLQEIFNAFFAKKSS